MTDTNIIEIRYFSGYIRNWRALCGELDISLTLSREEREEAILKAAYAKWGLEMMGHIFGMFAIALWDDEKKKLFVIRDQVGQKQMFYAVADGELICSGDTAEYILNGKTVLKLFDLVPAAGRIQLQSECHTIEYRNITIEPVAQK